MSDKEPPRRLGDVIAEDALEFINNPGNPFPPEDARNQIKYNLTKRGATKPPVNEPTKSSIGFIGEVETYLKNPHRAGLSDRKAAATVRYGRRPR